MFGILKLKDFTEGNTLPGKMTVLTLDISVGYYTALICEAEYYSGPALIMTSKYTSGIYLVSAMCPLDMHVWKIYCVPYLESENKDK